MSNSDNPKNGAAFQRKVREWFIKEYDCNFELEKKIAIGNPAKDHKFDIIIDDVERNAQFHFNTDEIPAYLSLRPFGKIIKCNITERLANIIKGLFTK